MRRSLVSISLFFIIVLQCMALDWGSYGLRNLSETKQGKQVIYSLSDTRNREFSIISDTIPKDTEMRKVLAFHERVRKWTTIKIAGMTFVIYPSEIEINIKVSDLVYQDVDLVPYISAGIGMFDANSLSYNFRLSVNRTYPRVNGLYESEEALCKAILDALRSVQPTPVKAPDPAPIPAPIPPVQKVVPAAVETPAPPIPPIASPPSPTQVTPEVPKTVDPALSDAYKNLRDGLDLLRSGNDSLQKELEQLRLDNQALRLDLERLRKAVLTLENLGIFGSVRVVNAAGIERILALKKEKPSLMQDEVMEILRKENIKMTSYEVFLVFSVYLNEFR